METQYTTAAVDLFLGEEFHVWDVEKLKFASFKPELDLAQQSFAQTAKAFLVPLKKQKDGSVIFSPFRERPWHLLAITRERVHLNRNFKLAARVEGRSSWQLIPTSAPAKPADLTSPESTSTIRLRLLDTRPLEEMSSAKQGNQARSLFCIQSTKTALS